MEGLDLPWRVRLDGADQELRPFHSQRALALRIECAALPAALALEPPAGLELALGALHWTLDAGAGARTLDAAEAARAAGYEVSAGEGAAGSTVYFTGGARLVLQLVVPPELRGRAGSITLQGTFGRRPRWMEQVNG
jgi:hypothetical protein